MIAPITPFAIRGVLWYQGETNALRAWDYRRLMTAMIQDWRRAWDRGDCRSCSCSSPTSGPSRRRSERRVGRAARGAADTLGLPNTGMAVAIDIGKPEDIHPKNKQDVGRRLALAARAVAYGERVVHAGPIFDGMTVEGGRVRVRFRHVGAGLALDAAKGSASRWPASMASSSRRPRRRRRHDRRVEPGRRRAGGGALRVGGRSDHEPAQQGRPAGVAVPHGHVLTSEGGTCSARPSTESRVDAVFGGRPPSRPLAREARAFASLQFAPTRAATPTTLTRVFPQSETRATRTCVSGRLAGCAFR